MKNTTLTLDPHRMASLFTAYGLPLPEAELVLFGLRGASPSDRNARWASACELALTPVDYIHMRCTLGIWDRPRKLLLLAPASTVPHADKVKWAAERSGRLRGRGTNQQEPGLYHDLTKGEHLQGKPRGHAALRQTGFRLYRRSAHAAPYRASDPLYFGNPYDNLHCAWNLGGLEAGYSSSGCLVVAGEPHCPRLPDAHPNRGAWKAFHDALYAHSQQRFSFLLLSAKEAALTLGETRPAPRLVYGSQGKAVADLQARLIKQGHLQVTGSAPKAVLGLRGYRAWNAAGLKGYGDVLGCG